MPYECEHQQRHQPAYGLVAWASGSHSLHRLALGIALGAGIGAPGKSRSCSK